MTVFTVELSHGRGEIDREADDITTRPDGSLWLLQAVGPPSTSKLIPVLVVADKVWTAVYPTGQPPLPPPQTAQTPATSPARLLGQGVFADPLRP